MTSTFGCPAVVAVLLLIATGLATAQEASIEMQITEKHALPGSHVTITCRVQNKGDDTMIIAKPFKVGGPENKGYSDTISLGGSLNPAPKLTGRYSLNVSPIGPTTKFYALAITNVTAEDSGPYTCFLLESGVSGETELLVYHPVQELMFNNETVGSTIVVNETSTIDLDCKAMGSIPAANVSVMLGDKDLTSQLHKVTTSDLHCDEGSIDHKTCLTYETFNLAAYTLEYKPTFEDHNKDLKCMATVGNGQIFESKEVIHKIEMHFSPKFDATNCKSTSLGRLHIQSYKLSCVIHSNPGYPDFTWQFMWEGRQERLANNQKTSDGEISAGQKDNGNGSIEVYLEFTRLNKRHFMTYTLSTNNSLGENVKQIKLEEDPRYRISLPPDDTVNGAGQLGLSAILVSIVALMKLSL